MDIMINTVMMYEGRKFDHDLVIHDDNGVICSGETYNDFINQCGTNFGESQSYDEYKKEMTTLNCYDSVYKKPKKYVTFIR